MDRYELFLLIHIVAAIVWLGSGLLLQIQAYRAERAEDSAVLRQIAEDATQLSNIVFIPASLIVVVFGALMVVDGPWSFDELWVALGLAGYVATFLTGVLVLKPASERVAQLMQRDGSTISAETTREIRKLLAKGRLDAVVLYLVVVVMVAKPTGDDIGVLVVLAAIVAAGGVWALQKLRAIETSAAQPAPARP